MTAREASADEMRQAGIRDPGAFDATREIARATLIEVLLPVLDAAPDTQMQFAVVLGALEACAMGFLALGKSEVADQAMLDAFLGCAREAADLAHRRSVAAGLSPGGFA